MKFVADAGPWLRYYELSEAGDVHRGLRLTERTTLVFPDQLRRAKKGLFELESEHETPPEKPSLLIVSSSWTGLIV